MWSDLCAVGGMSQPRRVIPGQTHMITRRCAGRQFLLAQTKSFEQLLLYCLAYAGKVHGIQVHGYKFLSRETTKWRMKVVDDHMNIRDIEKKIASGLIEELVFQAHNEIKLLRLMGKWKPWETFANDELDK